jgi:hypothetical protein
MRLFLLLAPSRPQRLREDPAPTKCERESEYPQESVHGVMRKGFVKYEHADHHNVDARDNARKGTDHGNSTSLETTLKDEQPDYRSDQKYVGIRRLQYVRHAAENSMALE